MVISVENKSDKKPQKKKAAMATSSHENNMVSFLLYKIMQMIRRNIPAEKKRKKFLGTINGSVYCFEITNELMKVTENRIARLCLILITPFIIYDLRPQNI